MIKKILLALDGSESSLSAMIYALDFAPENVEMILLTVMPSVVRADLEDALRSYHEKVLSQSKEKVEKARPDVMVVTRLEEGLPSDVIIYIAEEEDVDLIVMGSRGLGGIKGWILGSTSRSVVNRCTKPVLITKSPD